MNAHIKSYIEIYKKQHSKLSPFECLVIFRKSQVEFAKFCVISRNILKKIAMKMSFYMLRYIHDSIKLFCFLNAYVNNKR